jgi:2-iminobutanoate/2-iminopropanoate deaminase
MRINGMPPDDIEFLSPPGAIKPTGPWSLGVRAGDLVFVAGMRGIDPATGKLVDGAEARVRQAFRNMQTVVEAAGGNLRNAVRLVVYVTDMDRHRPLVNEIQKEFWGGGPYPPRTIVEVRRLNQDDIVEVEGTFFCPM